MTKIEGPLGQISGGGNTDWDNVLKGIQKEKESSRALVLMNAAELNKDPGKNLLVYRDMLLTEAPTVLRGEFGLAVAASPCDDNDKRRLIVKSDKGNVIAFAEVLVDRGYSSVAHIVTRYHEPTGKAVELALADRLTPAEVISLWMTKGGLASGEYELNRKKVEELGDRGDFALKMALLNDKPMENYKKYRDEFVNAVPAIMNRLNYKNGQVVVVGDDQLLVTDEDGILFSATVAAHRGFGSDCWITVQPFTPSRKKLGGCIDTQIHTFDSMFSECVDSLKRLIFPE